MKRKNLHSQYGGAFTLVELLVVIGIIAILAGVIVAGVGNAIRFAKRTKANADAVQIQTAVMNYYQEYGVYPTSDVTAAGDDYYDGSTAGAVNWENMMIALCGNINPSTGVATPSTVPNTRGVAYLTPTHSDLSTTTGVGILQNPFGSSGTEPYFYMAIDTDYSGVVGDSGAAAGQLPDFTQNTTNYTGAKLANGTPGGVAVWSPCDQPLNGGTTAHPSPPSFWAHTY